MRKLHLIFLLLYTGIFWKGKNSTVGLSIKSGLEESKNFFEESPFGENFVIISLRNKS